MNKLLCVFLCCMVVAYCATAAALPPLGLTNIDPAFGAFEIIDGTTYITAPDGIQTVSSTGDLSFISVTHPTLGLPTSVTRPVKAFDGELYVAANFEDTANFSSAPALFQLSEPSTPIVTWAYGSVNGVDAELRTFGNIESNCSGCYHATKFYVDGSTEPLPFPPGSVPNNSFTLLYSATALGYAIGEATVPKTAGIGPVVWTPAGEISFLDGGGVATSIRDRSRTDGVNVGVHDFNSPLVYYGENPIIEVLDENGNQFYDSFSDLSGFDVNVSHSDFVAIKYFDRRGEGFSEFYAFYPGIVPGFDNRAMPLLDVFPELSAIDIDQVHDLASVDGYLYMTLSGADGTFLFGARDPSVVPEPAGVALLSLLAITFAFRRGCR